MHILWCGALLFLFSALSALSQSFTGTITGTVTDANAAAVVGAKVTARNEATGDTRQAISSAEGQYIFSQLPPASYEVSAETPGFK